MKASGCACRYRGPIQVVACSDHNVAAKNLNRAQAMLLRLEVENDRLWALVGRLIGPVKRRLAAAREARKLVAERRKSR